MLSRRQSSTLPRGGKLNSLDRFTPLGLGTKPVETSKAYPAPNGYRVARPRRGEGSESVAWGLTVSLRRSYTTVKANKSRMNTLLI